MKNNYGILTDTSKGINEFLGDKSGRTISLRTAHGFKRFFNLVEMDDELAEHIVHGGMVAATSLMNSKKDENNSSGIMLSLALVLFYQLGK